LKKLKILNYAVNGLGLGHITRLIAINRWIKRITGALGIETEIFFLTSSECDTIAYHNGFAAFKIPSKNSLKATGITPGSYRKIAKQWVWNSINLISPNILIVDTFPFGSFNELFDVMDFGFKKVFIYRAIRPDIAEDSNFQKALQGYDKIITPVEFGLDDYAVSESLSERVFKTGEIISRNSDELLSRTDARERLGLSNESTVCYVTAGGGGDGEVELFWKNIIEAIENIEDIEFVIGAGPLYKGKEFRGKNIHWFYRYNAIEFYNAFDFAISAGGYNSVHELLYTKIPAIFFPQSRHYDDQERRIDNLEKDGLCFKLSSLDQGEILKKIDELRKPEILSQIKTKILSVFNKNYAFASAAEILTGFVDEDDMEHIENHIPGSYFLSLKEATISEKTGLKTIRVLDDNYHELKKLQNSLSAVSSYFDFDEEMRQRFSELNEKVYVDFMEYPLNNLALGFLKFIQKKEIDHKIGIRYLESFLKENHKPPKTIQDTLLEATAYIDLLLNKNQNINDALSGYIFENNNKSD
jgi:predicted glycosyltransferase